MLSRLGFSPPEWQRVQVLMSGCWFHSQPDISTSMATPLDEKGMPSIHMDMERGGELTLFVMMHYFGDTSANLSKKHSSTRSILARKSLLSLFCEHVESYPVHFKRGAANNFLRGLVLKEID